MGLLDGRDDSHLQDVQVRVHPSEGRRRHVAIHHLFLPGRCERGVVDRADDLEPCALLVGEFERQGVSDGRLRDLEGAALQNELVVGGRPISRLQADRIDARAAEMRGHEKQRGPYSAIR
jgi:hypothetical protein